MTHTLKTGDVISIIKQDCYNTWIACVDILLRTEKLPTRKNIPQISFSCGILAEICFNLFDAERMEPTVLSENLDKALQLATILAANLAIYKGWKVNKELQNAISGLPKRINELVFWYQNN